MISGITSIPTNKFNSHKDAEKQNLKLTKLSVTAEKGGLIRLKLNHTKFGYAVKGIVGKPILLNDILEADMQPGSTLEINLEY